MTEKEMLAGGCLCGAVRYHAQSKPFAADYCHCKNCLKSTGAPVSAWMDFKIEQVAWQSKDNLVEYESSPQIRRGFCMKCGSTLTFRSVSHPEYLTLAITSLDNPTSVNPTYHIYTENQLPWLVIDDSCRRHPQGQS